MKDIYNSHLDKAYRFFSFKALFDTINFNSLRFTRADSFNDPMDNSPLLVNLNWSEIVKLSNDVYNFAFYNVFNRVLSPIYVCCFSETYTSKESYLMWSHYANSHSGVCIEIDFGKENFCGSPSKVTYVPDLASERKKHNEDSDGLALFLVTTKSDLWKYEQEVRLVVDTEFNEKTSKLEKINDGKNIDVPFDISMISKVIFGLKSTQQDVNKTIKLFHDRSFNPKFELMTIDPVTLKPKFTILNE